MHIPPHNMTEREQDAFVHAFITRIGGVDEDAVAAWARGEPVDLPYKHIEILDDALSFWLFAVEFTVNVMRQRIGERL